MLNITITFAAKDTVEDRLATPLLWPLEFDKVFGALPAVLLGDVAEVLLVAVVTDGCEALFPAEVIVAAIVDCAVFMPDIDVAAAD